MLCDALITREDFNPKIKEMLIRKWLLNTANIPFNNGNTNIEGVLTLQGKQGIGKTRLIRKIIGYKYFARYMICKYFLSFCAFSLCFFKWCLLQHKDLNLLFF